MPIRSAVETRLLRVGGGELRACSSGAGGLDSMIERLGLLGAEIR